MSKHICPSCNKLHKIEYGKRKMPDGTLEDSNLLGYVKCGDNACMVTLIGESMWPKKPDNVVFMGGLKEDEG